MINVIEINAWLDGGSKQYRDSVGNFYVKDGRINSTTPGAIYDRYPEHEGAKLLQVELNVIGFDYGKIPDSPNVDHLFNNKQKL